VLGRHLDEDQGEAVGIARDDLEEAPRLRLGLLLDRYTPLRQPFPPLEDESVLPGFRCRACTRALQEARRRSGRLGGHPRKPRPAGLAAERIERILD
jgi:hypothetical protein